jgi:hypothetical protein
MLYCHTDFRIDEPALKLSSMKIYIDIAFCSLALHAGFGTFALASK